MMIDADNTREVNQSSIYSQKTWQYDIAGLEATNSGLLGCILIEELIK
ncbi:MAG: hypothetical protein WBP64_18050 [Nitrososphaeraceae archaeon]|jgi:hypothetical protein